MISPRLFEAVQNDMGERIWPQLQQHWPLIDYHGINDAFVIKYQQGGQEELRPHHDVAQVSASIKLNDTYEGATLEFPRQGANNSALPVGSLLAWPSLVTHPHHSTRITKGTKYSLTIWFELPLSLS
jgi:predicted 2-oxoglutarate/Fe(II)-dependent dioxygenase YbiX